MKYPVRAKVKKKKLLGGESSELLAVAQLEDTIGAGRFWKKVVYVSIPDDLNEAFSKINKKDKKEMKEFRKALDGFLKNALEKTKEYKVLGEGAGPRR